MKHRKLRIAWSVAWGIAAVLLVALWVRSSRMVDLIVIPLPNVRWAGIDSVPGALGAGIDNGNNGGYSWAVFDVESYRIDLDPEGRFNGVWGRFECSFGQTWFEPWVILPYWFLIVAAVATSAAPWIRHFKRFSLRTLLITTTLLAVALGTILYLLRTKPDPPSPTPPRSPPGQSKESPFGAMPSHFKIPT
jgi:hypothetical protein